MAHDTKPMYMRNYKGELIDADKPTYAPDGVICGAWRKVRKDGKVKFGGTWWQNEKLLPYIDKWVWCEVTEYWHVATSIYHNRPGMRKKDHFEEYICTAK